MSRSRIIPCRIAYRTYGISPTRPLQKIFGFGKSEKEKEADEAVKKAKQASDSLKETADHIKKTSEHIKHSSSSTYNHVMNLGRDVKGKVLETADVLVDKFVEPIKGVIKEPIKGVINNTTERIEDKVAEKIRDRVIGKEGDRGKIDEKKSS